MMTIRNNTDTNFTSVRAIANEVWPIAYGAILSPEQLKYMMEMMYSVASLQKQAQEHKNQFILAIKNEIPVGFAAFEIDYGQTSKTKIHKIYILSNQQGNGIGRNLMDYITQQAIQNKQEALLLNVNKFNSAQYFYKKLGFVISYEEIIDIGNGYVMDDFVMEKPI